MDVARTRRVVAVGARASWTLPLGALCVIGFAERGSALLPFSTGKLVALALAAAVPGLSIGVGALLGSREAPARRHAILGIVASASVLLLLAVGFLSGAASAEQAEREMRAASEAAVRDYPGWNGGAMVGDASVYAFQIDGRSALARLALRAYDRPYQLMLVGVDNRRGDREVVIDLGDARIVLGDAATVASIPRDEPPLHVAPGGQADGQILLFPPDASFVGASALQTTIDGRLRVIPGRYFTLDEKRAIDAQRRP